MAGSVIRASGTKTTKRALTGIGALCLAGGTGALTMGAIAPAHAAGATPLNYTCEAQLGATAVPQGTWTAAVTTDAPASVEAGATIPAPQITAVVTTSEDAANTLRDFLGAASVDGTSAAEYAVTGDVAKPGKRTGDLTIPMTKVPAKGPLTTKATGSGQAEAAGSSAGTIKVTVGDFKAAGSSSKHTQQISQGSSRNALRHALEESTRVEPRLKAGDRQQRSRTQGFPGTGLCVQPDG